MTTDSLSAVILDFDGVIVDTESVELDLWKIFYARHGLELSPQLWSSRVGAPDDPALWHPIRHFETVTGRALDVRTRREMTRHFYEVCHALPLQPGIEALLEWAAAHGVGLAVASSNSRFWVDSFLHQHSIREYFGAVCAIEDVTQGKPAPDLYLGAAGALGVDPRQSLAVEDAPTGLRAAIAADIGCVVAVPNALTRSLPFPAGVHERVDSLEGFDPLTAYAQARSGPTGTVGGRGSCANATKSENGNHADPIGGAVRAA